MAGTPSHRKARCDRMTWSDRTNLRTRSARKLMILNEVNRSDHYITTMLCLSVSFAVVHIKWTVYPQLETTLPWTALWRLQWLYAELELLLGGNPASTLRVPPNSWISKTSMNTSLVVSSDPSHSYLTIRPLASYDQTLQHSKLFYWHKGQSSASHWLYLVCTRPWGFCFWSGTKSMGKHDST